jgi:hypothetical protein
MQVSSLSSGKGYQLQSDMYKLLQNGNLKWHKAIKNSRTEENLTKASINGSDFSSFKILSTLGTTLVNIKAIDLVK